MQVTYNPHKKKNDTDNGESIAIVVGVGCELTSSVDIINLIPNTEYHIGVTAYTSIGAGAIANLLVTTSNEIGKFNHNSKLRSLLVAYNEI